MRVLPLIVLFAAVLHAGELAQATEPQQPSTLALKVSFSALVAAEGADLWSSHGKIEGEPLLRAPDGTFSDAKGIALKGAALAALGLTEAWWVRKHPKAARAFTWLNYGLGGATAAIAAHNFSVK